MENVYPAVKNTMPAYDELLKLNLFWSMIVLLLQKPSFIRRCKHFKKSNEMYNPDLKQPLVIYHLTWAFQNSNVQKACLFQSY